MLGLGLASSKLGLEELADSLDRSSISKPATQHAADRDRLVWHILDSYFLRIQQCKAQTETMQHVQGLYMRTASCCGVTGAECMHAGVPRRPSASRT